MSVRRRAFRHSSPGVVSVWSSSLERVLLSEWRLPHPFSLVAQPNALSQLPRALRPLVAIAGLVGGPQHRCSAQHRRAPGGVTGVRRVCVWVGCP